MSIGKLLTTVAAMFGAVLFTASPASAYNVYKWYTPMPPFINAWQTATPPSSALTGYDNINQNYLSSHLLDKGGLGDVENIPSGDYCNDYNTGVPFNQGISTNLGSATGFSPPAPYASYQYGDGYGNACQAQGQVAFWGQRVVRGAPNNNCYFTCGVQRFVSLQSQDDRPWSTVFGNPSLELYLQQFRPTSWATTGTPAGGWSYMCPIVQDRTTGNVLEFCIQLWQPQAADASWPKTDASGVCNTAVNDTGSRPFDLTITKVGGSTFVTKQADSSDTIIGGIGTGPVKFHVTISTANLTAAINANNVSCGRANSTSPANYRLMGVEVGTEAWRNFSSVGTSSQGLTVQTLYGNP